MSITDARLAQIAELEKKINEKADFLIEKQAELETMGKIAVSMPAEVMRVVSQSASTSLHRRGLVGTVDIEEAAARNAEIIKDLKDALAKAQTELEALKIERDDLIDFTGGC